MRINHVAIATLFVAGMSGNAFATYITGDVFAAIGGGLVGVYTPAGTRVQILNDRTGAPVHNWHGFRLINEPLRHEFS